MSHREKQLKKSAVRVVESDLGVIDLPYLLLTLLLLPLWKLQKVVSTKNSKLSLLKVLHLS